MGKGYGLLGRSLNLEMKNLEYGLMGYGMKSLEGSWVGNLIEKKKATLWEKVMEYLYLKDIENLDLEYLGLHRWCCPCRIGGVDESIPLK